MKFGGAVITFAAFSFKFDFMPFLAVFWQNLHKFNAKKAAVKFTF
nr:hypothetical protein [uncultured Campylobacter sp.]